VAIAAATALVIANQSLSQDEPEPIVSKVFYPQIARVVADGMPQAHVSHAALGDSIAEKALDIYLASLDFDRSYFLEADIAAYRQAATELDDQLRDGHLAFAYEVFEQFKHRARERLAYVEQAAAEDFDFSVEETYETRRKDLPWPGDAAAQDELWRKKLKHEVLARLVADRIAEEFPPAEGEEDEAGVDWLSDRELSPVERVVKMHRQFASVIAGHDAEWVLQTYLNAFTQAYDTHSAYLSPRAVEDFDISMRLSLTGIGAVLQSDDGAAKIVRLMPGGPAEQDGRLRPGDRIVAVAQAGEEPVDILYWPLYKAVRLIRGEAGTPVVLDVVPASAPAGGAVKRIELVRDTIKLEEREARAEVREVPAGPDGPSLRLGILTLPDFYADQQALRRGDEDSKSSAQDVSRLLAELKGQAVNGILLDLRNNGGGSLQEAVDMTGFFIDRGPVVQVKASRVQSLRDPNPGEEYDGPLVVLVNRLSASASEILAGALQDYGRAVIVGDTRTHGKGTVQSVFPIDRLSPSLGSLKVTTAAFYRVNGHSTQLKGIQPDIVIPSEMDVMEIGEEFLPNVLPWSWVSPARYRPYEALARLLDPLRQASEDRRAQSEAFRDYNDLIARLDQRLDMTEVSLQQEQRLIMAREDRQINELQERIRERMLQTSASNGEASGEEEDLILGESLNILRDLVNAWQVAS
jgi:carboxyl-terminal processing protease